MPRLLTLESFEDALADQQGPTADYTTGYAEGFAAGEASVRADVANLNEQFVQSVQDITFTFAEARAQILNGLAPMLQTVIAQVLPHCVETGFAGQLAELLTTAAEQDATRPLAIHLHPDSFESVAGLSDVLPKELSIQIDPALSPHAAWIAQADGEMRLDADQLLATISETLSVLNTPEDRNAFHG